MNYQFLEKKIERCAICSIKTEVEANVKYGSMYGYGGNTIMVCGIAPSYIRGSSSKYTISTDHSNYTAGILFNMFDEIKWPVKKTYFTNLVKCSLPDNRKPNNQELEACFNYWFVQELFLVNPVAIICLGNFVYEYLQIKEWNIPIELYKVYHFSYISRRKDVYNEWKMEWIRIGKEIRELTGFGRSR